MLHVVVVDGRREGGSGQGKEQVRQSNDGDVRVTHLPGVGTIFPNSSGCLYRNLRLIELAQGLAAGQQ